MTDTRDSQTDMIPTKSVEAQAEWVPLLQTTITNFESTETGSQTHTAGDKSRTSHKWTMAEGFQTERAQSQQSSQTTRWPKAVESVDTCTQTELFVSKRNPSGKVSSLALITKQRDQFKMELESSHSELCTLRTLLHRSKFSAGSQTELNAMDMDRNQSKYENRIKELELLSQTLDSEKDVMRKSLMEKQALLTEKEREAANDKESMKKLLKEVIALSGLITESDRLPFYENQERILLSESNPESDILKAKLVGISKELDSLLDDALQKEMDLSETADEKMLLIWNLLNKLRRSLKFKRDHEKLYEGRLLDMADKCSADLTVRILFCTMLTSIDA